MQHKWFFKTELLIEFRADRIERHSPLFNTNNAMLISIILLAAIAISLTIVWDVKRRKNLLKNPRPPQKPSEKAKWLFTIACAILFGLSGIWAYFDPPEPSFGAKGLLFHLAYLLIGKYGPSLMFFVYGFICFIISEKHRRNIQKNCVK